MRMKLVVQSVDRSTRTVFYAPISIRLKLEMLAVLVISTFNVLGGLYMLAHAVTHSGLF